MKKYASDNLMAFREHFPDIYHLVRNRDRDRERFVQSMSRCGAPNLDIRHGELIVSMYSKYDPIHEARAWVEKISSSIQDDEHIFIYGFGLGYHIEQLIERYPNCYIHILEPELQILLAAIETRDLRPILNHTRIGVFGVGDHELITHEYCIHLTKQLKTGFQALYMPYYVKHHAPHIEQTRKFIQSSVLTARTNYATMIVFREEWPENIILNIRHTINSRPIHALQNRFADVPAIVVGSGPSLNEDIEYLKQYAGRAIIFSAGSSVQALLHHGLRPHVVISFDGSERNYDVFKDLDMTGIPFIYASFLKYKILNDFKSLEDVYHVFISSDPITRYLFGVENENKVFHSTASVTGAVIQTAAYLGCSTIVLVGQDLSYPNRIMYASGVDHFSEEEQKKIADKAEVWVDNVQGGKNPTTKAMQNTLENIQDLIMTMSHRVRFYNTSANGANIEGAPHLPMRDLEPMLPKDGFDTETFRLTLREKTSEYGKREIEQVVKKAIALRAELKRLKDRLLPDISNQLETLKDVLLLQNEKKVAECLKKIHVMWDKITAMRSFNAIYEMVVQAQISIYQRHIPDIVNETNTIRRGELIRDHLGSLIGAMCVQTPQLDKLFEQAIRQLTESEKVG